MAHFRKTDRNDRGVVRLDLHPGIKICFGDGWVGDFGDSMAIFREHTDERDFRIIRSNDRTSGRNRFHLGNVGQKDSPLIPSENMTCDLC